MDKEIGADMKGPDYKRCPGYSSIGHSCGARTLTRMRCRSCERVYQRHMAYLNSLKQPTFERWCLKCDKKFIAKNRFLRLCGGCRSGNHSAEFTGVDETRYAISFGGRK